jgi:hypothetical protein
LEFPAVGHDVRCSCFGRISESVFNELKSLDDLITKMGQRKMVLKLVVLENLMILNHG